MKLLDLINEEESEEKLRKKAHAVYKFLKTGTIEFYEATFKYVLSDEFNLDFYTIQNQLTVPVVTPNEITITRLEDPLFPYRHKHAEVPFYQIEMYLQKHYFFKYNMDITIPHDKHFVKGDVEFPN